MVKTMYLLVGGSGFIGTRLANRLTSRGTPFSIIDKIKSQSYPESTQICDVRDKDKLLNCEIRSSILVNLAAEHRDDVRPKCLYDEVNVGGAQNVCEFADKKGIKTIIFTSTVAVYGFAERGIDEEGEIRPFNDYGRTKHEAELIYKKWQSNDHKNKTLIIIRPTVVFGERNRGNVYNLFRQIASGKFLMIGDGNNRKSLAYVENVAAFIEYSSELAPGVHIYNYVDKPDFNMNELVEKVKSTLGKEKGIGFRLPYWFGLMVGYFFDLVAIVSRRSLPISSVRVQKFCKDSVYSTQINETGFKPPVDLQHAIANTIKYEFIDKKRGEVFFSE